MEQHQKVGAVGYIVREKKNTNDRIIHEIWGSWTLGEWRSVYNFRAQAMVSGRVHIFCISQ